MGSKREYLGGGIYKEGDVFRLILYVNGKRYVESCPARTEKQARLMRAKRLIDIKEGRFFEARQKKQKLFRELMEEYLEYSRASKRSYKRDETSSKYLLKTFGSYPLDKILPSTIKTYITKRKKMRTRFGKAVAPATINRELALLKTVLNWAVNDDMLDKNPMRSVKLLPEQNARDRTLTPDEFRRLYDCAASHLKPILILAYYTAMCKTEILELTWDRVDLERRQIILEDEHTKKRPRKVPIPENVANMFQSLPRSLKHDRVFLRKGRPIKSIKETFKSAARQASLEDLWFHDLRHTAITNMRKAGVPDRVIMTISGHKTLWMLHRYDKIDEEDLREAVNKTATYTATNPKKDDAQKEDRRS